MDNDQYLYELASRLNFVDVGSRQPFPSESSIRWRSLGTIVGERSGYLISISLCRSGNQKLLTILLRYPRLESTSTLNKALKKNFGSLLAISKRVQVKPTHAEIRWIYSVRKPDLDEVVALIAQLVESLSMHARPFDGRCEDCGESRTSEITLFNDIPGYHCAACQQRTIAARQIQSAEYGTRNMDFVWGFFWAAMAGLGCAIVTGIVEFLFDERGRLPWQILLACPAFTGIVIGAVFGKRVGRLDLRKQGAALFLLTLCATLFGELFYASIYVVRTFHVAITPHLLIAIFRGLMRYRAKFDGLVIQATQLFGAFICIGFARLQRPIFRAEYISISEARTRAAALPTTELSIL